MVRTKRNQENNGSSKRIIQGSRQNQKTNIVNSAFSFSENILTNIINRDNLE